MTLRRSVSDWSAAFLALAVAQASVSATPLRFSIPGGVYTNDLSLQLSASPPAIIYFTLDGSEPTATSTVYSAGLNITNSTLVRARAFEAGAPAGPPVSQTYVLLSPELLDFSSNLPLVIINTFGEGLAHETRVPISVRFIDGSEVRRSTLTGSADFDGRAMINIRGTSSLQFPKHSFTFRTRDEAGNGLRAAILGFPADSDWILYAPYPDKTLMRDVLAYDLSRQMGHYAARTRFVELFISRSGHRLGRGHYAGLYVLEEKIKRGRERVNIEKLNPEDNQEPEITGGYIFKKDHEEKGLGEGFTTSRGIHFFYVDPKETELTSQQKSWLPDYLNRFEKALYGPAFKDRADGYAGFIDADSFIDLHWIVEFSKNIDGYRLSNYLHKDRQGKLKMEPIWDWNLSFGNADYLDGWMPDGWYWPLVSRRDYPWFGRLFQDPDFKQKYIDRWSQLRTNQFALSNLLAKVDAFSAQLQEAQARNFKRWRILGQWVWPNWYVGGTYAEEVNWMKSWLEQRVAWIDAQFLPPPAVSIQTGAKASERLVRLQAATGEISYTVDGSDPRSSGGAVSPHGQPYRDAIAIGETTKLFARARTTNAWSAPVVCSWEK
jgi:hypothetical protein